MPVRCVSFDADDTLWDFTAAMWAGLDIALAAGRAVDPEAVSRLTAEELHGLRDRLADEAEASGERHRLAEIRRRSFVLALEGTGRAADASATADVMADAYFAHRHDEVALHPEVVRVVDELAGRYVLGLVTNGNTDAERSGLAGRFDFRLAADDIGIRKPDRRMFTMAAAAAGCHPAELVYVGDDLDKDVAASQAAGCRAVWLNRTGADRPPSIEPDATITDLTELPAVLARFDEVEAAAAGAVGVGPHPEPWPSDARLDPDLLAAGDQRNVVDRYRYWREAAIVADLDARRHPFHVAVENWRHDRNIGAVVRNANAFGAAGVHIVGRRRWNRRGAMATDRYLHVHHHDTVEQLVAWAAAEGLAVVGIDNVAGSVPIEGITLPERCVLLFGQEGPGLSPAALAASAMVCSIAQFGSTRSVNAGVASGITMHEWIRVYVET
ncbi:MAG: putative methyltransferase [Acidimicrobiales bacterium]|nr:putative methyltransferase [Acidimicrobiales bacterium]